MIKSYQQLDLFGKKIFEKACLQPPIRLAAEMPNDACFYYVLRGESRTFTPTGQVRSSQDEGVVMQCGTYLNEYFSQGGIEDDCEAVAVHFYPEVLKMLYDKDFPNFMLQVGKVQPLRHRQLKSSSLLKNYINSLLFYFDNPELVSEEILKLKLKELILLLAQTDNAEAIRDLLASLFTPETLDFKTVVEAHVYHNISVNELAQLAHLSLSSFKREFARHYDCPPARYLKQRKLEKAAQLLIATELRVSDIAFDCGFVDLAHFSKSFLKEHGCSPSDYRRLNLD
ncbi:MAG: AraC family transcriptional regulator [Bacteroidota bacterium]